MNRAIEIIHEHNPNALVGIENGYVCAIEDVTDPDGRMYRTEYMTTPDGEHAVAYCRSNPWDTTPNAGEPFNRGHVDKDGFICLGNEHEGRVVENSPYTLEFVIVRARYWVTGFSILKETGSFPSP